MIKYGKQELKGGQMMSDEEEFIKRIKRYDYISLTISIIMIGLGLLFVRAIVIRVLETL